MLNKQSIMMAIFPFSPDRIDGIADTLRTAKPSAVIGWHASLSRSQVSAFVSYRARSGFPVIIVGNGLNNIKQSVDLSIVEAQYCGSSTYSL